MEDLSRKENGGMKMTEVLLQELEMEMANTRKTLERIPNKFDWKPHEKSMSMGRLAIHLAEIPAWTEMTVKQDEFDVAPAGAPPYESPKVGTPKEVLDLFDKNLASARSALKEMKDEDLMKSWSLKSGGKTIMTMPKAAVLRGFVLNHNVHHRAQMGVYLRLNNIPVPSIYGPSADEGEM
jgi:uncharacterized damage-inducible protein DinB